MKTILTGLVLLLAAIIAIKLMPLTLVLGFVLGLALFAILALGLSAAAILVCVVLAVVAVLAPIWIPVLVVMGLIALIKRCTQSARPASVTG